MGIDQTIVFCFTLVVCIFLMAVMIESVMPLYLKLQFDNICRNYSLIIEANNGLSEAEEEEFRKKLIDMDLNVEKLSCTRPHKTKKGDWILLEVEGIKEMNSSVGLFKREVKAYRYSFIQDIVSTRAIN